MASRMRGNVPASISTVLKRLPPAVTPPRPRRPTRSVQPASKSTRPSAGTVMKVCSGACAADPGQPRRRVAVGLQAGSRARVRYRSLSGRCRRAQSARHPSAAGTVGQRRPCADNGPCIMHQQTAPLQGSVGCVPFRQVARPPRHHTEISGNLLPSGPQGCHRAFPWCRIARRSAPHRKKARCDR